MDLWLTPEISKLGVEGVCSYACLCACPLAKLDVCARGCIGAQVFAEYIAGILRDVNPLRNEDDARESLSEAVEYLAELSRRHTGSRAGGIL